jgi:hypothetical protein
MSISKYLLLSWYFFFSLFRFSPKHALPLLPPIHHNKPFSDQLQLVAPHTLPHLPYRGARLPLWPAMSLHCPQHLPRSHNPPCQQHQDQQHQQLLQVQRDLRQGHLRLLILLPDRYRRVLHRQSPQCPSVKVCLKMLSLFRNLYLAG